MDFFVIKSYMLIVTDFSTFSCILFGGRGGFLVYSSCKFFTMDRLDFAFTAESKNAKGTSSSLIYHRWPANLLLAAFEMAGFSFDSELEFSLNLDHY